MKKAIIIIIVIVVILVAWRYLHAIVLSYTGGQSSDSPDGKFHARAYNVIKERFWGGQFTYYELVIEPAGSIEPKRRIVMMPPDGEPPYYMRGNEKVIHWADDSKSVTFKFQGIELKMNVE